MKTFWLIFLSAIMSAQTWTKVNLPSGVVSVSGFAIKASNGHWFMTDRATGVWKSTDQGNTWVQINNGIPSVSGTSQCTGATTGTCGWKIGVNQHNGSVVAAIGLGGSVFHYYVSTDETNFTQIPEPSGFFINNGSNSGALMPPATGGTMLFNGAGCTGCVIMRSTDDGVTTHLSTQNPGQGFSRSVGLNGSVNGSGGENGGFYTSTDNGVTFNKVWDCGNNIGPACSNVMDSAEVYSQITDVMGNWVLSTRTGVWKSGGPVSNPNSWTHLYTSSSRSRVVFRDSGNNYYFGQNRTATNWTVARSTDGGNTWQEFDNGIGTGLEAWQFVEDVAHKTIYTVIENGATNQGWLYEVVLGPAPQVPNPPTGLAGAAQ